MTLMTFFVLLHSTFGHAGLLSAWSEKFRADPPEIKIVRAHDERGLRLAEPIERLVHRGDRVQFSVFEGAAAALIKEANRDARVAEAIRGVNYYYQRGMDVAYDQDAAAARDQALSQASRFDIVAGQDMKLISLKRILEDARWFWTPREVIWSREYYVPKAVWHEPVDRALPRRSNCTIALESEDMLAEERLRIERLRGE